MIKILGKENSIFNQFLSELREHEIQKDNLRFRRNLERLGEIFAYEISKTLPYKKVEIVTPLGVSKMEIPAEQPVLATILRAGMPLHQGLLNYFDRAESAFVSAYRKYSKDEKFTIKLDYLSGPGVGDRILILSDTMLATGGSLVSSLKGLVESGNPTHIHIVIVLASVEGIAHVKKSIPMHNVTLWLGAVDDELTAKAYIVPGLGDAGDLAYGKKED